MCCRVFLFSGKQNYNDLAQTALGFENRLCRECFIIAAI